MNTNEIIELYKEIIRAKDATMLEKDARILQVSNSKDEVIKAKDDIIRLLTHNNETLEKQRRDQKFNSSIFLYNFNLFLPYFFKFIHSTLLIS
jgi:hypothetical protein